MAVGRKGADWLAKMCEKHLINNRAGIIDAGVRYELPDNVMKDINKYLYEGNFVANIPLYKDKVTALFQLKKQLLLVILLILSRSFI